MSSIVARTTASLVFASASAVLMTPTSSAQSSDYVRFQPDIATVSDGTLVPLPNVAAVMTPRTVISPGAAAQLTGVVDAVLASRPDGNAFEPRYDGQTWKLAVRTEPRSAVAGPLVAPLVTKMIECIHSLEPSTAAGELLVAASGFAPDGAANVAAAKEGAAQLVTNLASGCTPKKNDATVDTARVRVTLEGMLTGQFDSTQIALSEVNTIASILTPVVLGKTGLYARQRSDDLRTILTDALSRGLPTERAFDASAGAAYETFYDFLKATVLANREVSTDYFVGVGRACIASTDALSQPFSLSTCIGAGKLTKVKLWLGGQGYVLAAEAR